METPCKDRCLYSHELGFCESCGRTLKDLEQWTKITREDRRLRTMIAKDRLRKLDADRSSGQK